MIGCPSDITQEKDVACEVLNNWNNLNSEKSRMVLLPIHWSISSYPAMGKHPQKLLNEQLVEKSDLMICVFGTRIGSPTDTEISGTVEEIHEHRKAGKDVMVFFKLSVDDISSVDPQQLQKIKDFKDSIKNDTLWCEFTSTSDFEKKFLDALQLYVNDHWLVESRSADGKNLQEGIVFSDKEVEIITQWTQSGENEGLVFGFENGSGLFILGGKQYEVGDGKDMANWEDFMERLLKRGFIEIEKYNTHGEPVYKLKKAAYDYVDSITEKIK